MKKYILAAALVLSGSAAFAQYNMATTYCAHNDLNASRYEPSELDLGDRRIQLGFNAYLWTGNSALSYDRIKSIRNTGRLTGADVDGYIDAMQSVNRFGLGYDIQLGGLGFQVKTKSDKRYDFAVTVVDKFGSNIQYTKEFAQLIWRGNAQFAGQTLQLGNNRISANYTREYAFAAAFPLFGSNGREEGFGMRLGLRAKYVQGLASVQIERSDISMTTASDGSTITMQYDYVMHTSGMSEPDKFSFKQNNGQGYGADIGLAMFFGKNFEVNASVIDLGKVTYNKGTKTFSKTGSYVYDGGVISQFFGDVNYQDSLGYIFEPDQTAGASYDVQLGTRFLLQAEFKTPKLGQKDREYVSNAIYFTYVQGLRNAPNATTKPYFSLAYNHDFHKHFDLGAMVAYGGFNKVAVGAFCSVNVLNTFKIGFGSDNLMPLLVPSAGTGIDGSVNLSLSF